MGEIIPWIGMAASGKRETGGGSSLMDAAEIRAAIDGTAATAHRVGSAKVSYLYLYAFFILSKFVKASPN